MENSVLFGKTGKSVRLKSFRGGIHPSTFKEITQSESITIVPPPKVAITPLSQHTGAPSEPIVEPGQVVKAGERIAEPNGFVSVPQHASISGKVVEIANHPHPVLGKKTSAVVIESDGEDAWMPFAKRDVSNLSKEEIISAISEGGVVGLGGAAFPTHVKLSPPPDKTIDTVVINGAECEPYITCDHRIMLEKTEEILKGIEVVRKVLAPERCVIGIEVNKYDAVEMFLKASGDSGIEVVGLKVKYPQGDEKQMIAS